eukprot:501770-Hanusia_phi.AAC.5
MPLTKGVDQKGGTCCHSQGGFPWASNHHQAMGSPMRFDDTQTRSKQGWRWPSLGGVVLRGTGLCTDPTRGGEKFLQRMSVGVGG